MFWADKTHFYSATDCLHTGSPCPAAVRLINKLSEALSKAETVTTANFEITGQTRLPGCPAATRIASHSIVQAMNSSAYFAVSQKLPTANNLMILPMRFFLWEIQGTSSARCKNAPAPWLRQTRTQQPPQTPSTRA